MVRRVPSAPIDLVTIAFANTALLRHQHRLLSTYVARPFVWIVADNSPTRESASAVRSLCEELGAVYWRIPHKPYTAISPSHSHGFALNLSWRCVLRRRRSTVIGFLDHDIFPIEAFDPRAVLANQPVWGRLQRRGDHWYIWPGLFLARTDYARARGLDFLPGFGVDTGGRNEVLVLRDLDPESLVLPMTIREQVRGDGTVNESDYIERIGGWAHTINGSNWFKVPSKDAAIEALLSKY